MNADHSQIAQITVQHFGNAPPKSSHLNIFLAPVLRHSLEESGQSR